MTRTLIIYAGMAFVVVVGVVLAMHRADRPPTFPPFDASPYSEACRPTAIEVFDTLDHRRPMRPGGFDDLLRAFRGGAPSDRTGLAAMLPGFATRDRPDHVVQAERTDLERVALVFMVDNFGDQVCAWAGLALLADLGLHEKHRSTAAIVRRDFPNGMYASLYDEVYAAK